MKVGIVGSRDFAQLELVRGFVRKLAAKYPDAVVVSGDARGVDRTAELTAYECDLSVLSYRPYEDMGEFWVRRYEDAVDAGDWSGPFPSYGRAAFDRNRDIVRSCDRLVAFWDGKSKGTRHSIRLAQDAGKPVHIIRAG